MKTFKEKAREAILNTNWNEKDPKIRKGRSRNGAKIDGLSLSIIKVKDSKGKDIYYAVGDRRLKDDNGKKIHCLNDGSYTEARLAFPMTLDHGELILHEPRVIKKWKKVGDSIAAEAEYNTLIYEDSDFQIVTRNKGSLDAKTYAFTYYLSEGDLKNNFCKGTFNNVPFDERSPIALDIINHVIYLHEVERLVHRDLKPENTLFI